MKVWLDDERLPPEGWEWCKTAHEAIVYLDTGKVTHISLDHDIGPTERHGGMLSTGQKDVGCGCMVSRYIEAGAYHGEIPRLQWNVHTANAGARPEMERGLQNADRYWGKEE